MSSHYIIVCSCGNTIARCRCSGPGKLRTERKEGCSTCLKKKRAAEAVQAFINVGDPSKVMGYAPELMVNVAGRFVA